MPRISKLREEKRRLIAARDGSLTPRRRLELGAAQAQAARTLFFAGLKALGFSRAQALREWRHTG